MSETAEIEPIERLPTVESVAAGESPALVRHHESLLDAHAKLSEEFPKMLLLMSGGALGLSVTFLEKLAPKPRTHTGWLLVAWALLVICLIAVVASVLLSMSAVRAILDQWEAHILGRNVATLRTKWVARLNVVAGGAVVAGLAVLALFAFLNAGEPMPIVTALPVPSVQPTAPIPTAPLPGATYVPTRPPAVVPTHFTRALESEKVRPNDHQRHEKCCEAQDWRSARGDQENLCAHEAAARCTTSTGPIGRRGDAARKAR